MKIAILTLPLHTNFGGILQAYALQTVLQEMKNEVCVLEVARPTLSKWSRYAIFVKRLVKFLARRESRFYGSMTEWEIVNRNTLRFIDTYIHREFVGDLSDLREGEFDAIVVGSDQIWRPKYYQPICNAYLEFAREWRNVKRVAYAASFGTGDWEYSPQETQECSRLLKMFDAVSVREFSGVGLCKKNLDVDAVQMLDPTLLLDKNIYLSLSENVKAGGQENGLLSYFLDESEEKKAIARSLADKYGFSLFRNNNPSVEKYRLSFEERIQSSVEQWIAGFRDAKFVVTDSFHGCVFSIIFNRPFIVLSNQKRGVDRVASLLSILGLEDRMIFPGIEMEEIYNIMSSDIDWPSVNGRLRQWKDQSYMFLSLSL